MQEEQQNIEPNQSPELAQLIRDNLDYQTDQQIKKTLYKESMVKLSLDKDFEGLFDAGEGKEKENVGVDEVSHLIEVCSEIKAICSWLEESEEFKGMAYLPLHHTPQLLHILQQKAEHTVIVITAYQSYWLQKMQAMSRLSMIKWGFLNETQSQPDKVKILELYEMKKIKLLFITPSLLNSQDYLDFESDIVVFPDLHLFARSRELLAKCISRCNPGRVLGLHSNLIRSAYTRLDLGLTPINHSSCDDHTFIALKTQSEEKFKTLLAYLQKSNIHNSLVLVRNRSEVNALTKKLKLKSLTTLNIHDCLSSQEMSGFTAPQILSRGQKDQEKVMETVYRGANFNITICKYFDALRFGSFDCVVFYSFVDVPTFVESCPGVKHRLVLLAEDDYFSVRNEITCDYLDQGPLSRIVMKMMEKPRRKQGNGRRRFYSDHIEDRLLECYSVSKNYTEKNQEKVIRINWFCKTYDISHRTFRRVIEGLCSSGVMQRNCKLVYEVELEQQSMDSFRRLYPKVLEIQQRVNILNLSSSLQKTTKMVLNDFRNQGIQFRVLEEALQLRVLKEYGEVDWEQLGSAVNQSVHTKSQDLDFSYHIFKECCYGSIELTRRESALKRKNVILNFYCSESQTAKHSNLFDSSHRSNLLTSQIEEWLRNRDDSLPLEEHELILLLQGVDCQKVSSFKENPIYGRYRRVRYEDLSQVVSRICKHKRVKLC